MRLFSKPSDQKFSLFDSVEDENDMPPFRAKIEDENGATPIPIFFDGFIKKRTHIAVVVDEFGNTVGLVTMEDIIETC